jgi:hypothetical protein
MKKILVEANYNTIHAIDQVVTFENKEKFAIVYSDYYERQPEYFDTENDVVEQLENIQDYTHVCISIDCKSLYLYFGEITEHTYDICKITDVTSQSEATEE